MIDARSALQFLMNTLNGHCSTITLIWRLLHLHVLVASTQQLLIFVKLFREHLVSTLVVSAHVSTCSPVFYKEAAIRGFFRAIVISKYSSVNHYGRLICDTYATLMYVMKLGRRTRRYCVVTATPYVPPFEIFRKHNLCRLGLPEHKRHSKR